MLREARARWLAFATAAAVVGLAALFAGLRNPAVTAPESTSSQTSPADPDHDAARWAVARAAFVRLDCTRCHAIQGVGNPSSPLDGVGARLDRAELLDWTLGRGVAEADLPRSIVRRKQLAAQDTDLDALIEYLQNSR